MIIPALNLQLIIVKMEEKAVGNIQIFARALRLDVQYESNFDKLSNGYDISCWQTKSGLDLNECLARSWFDMSLFARFCGISMKEVSLQNMSQEEKDYIIEQITVVM